MQVVFSQTLGAIRFAWDAHILKTGDHVACLVERPDGAVEVKRPGKLDTWMVEESITAAQTRINTFFEKE